MSKNPHQLHLNAFLMSVGHHEASWRLPESDPYAGWSVRHYEGATLRDHYGLPRPANRLVLTSEGQNR
jgi:hypothetical protein